MDFPEHTEDYSNWDAYYQDPFNSYSTNNVIYPNTQEYPSPAPSTASSTHNITELGTMPDFGTVPQPQIFPGYGFTEPTPSPVEPLILPLAPPPTTSQFPGDPTTKNPPVAKLKPPNLKRYSCDECPEVFSTTQDRTMHKIHNHEGRRYSAKKRQPPPSSTTAKDFQQVRRFDCEKCQEFFMHKHDLLKHVRNRHTGTGEFPCKQCSTIFYTYDMFVEHRDLHDESIPKYSCEVCDKKFLSERKLKDHSAIHKERTFYKCEICGVVFLRSQTLQYHRMTCRAEYKCDRCVDSFMTKEGLDTHQALHSSNNKFMCEKCHKIFRDQWTLQNHEKRHTLKMNYTCCVCGELMGTRADYQKHLKDHIEANLKCRDCSVPFSNLVKYGIHKAEMHAVLRPYDCILCPEEFCTRKELFAHLQNHNEGNVANESSEQISPLTCDSCGGYFATNGELENHKQVQHGTQVDDNVEKNGGK